jgi:hypothetical protein
MDAGQADPDSQNGNEDRPHKLETLFDDLLETADDDPLTVGRILDAVEKRSYGPLLLLPALISVVPGIGALPGVTWTTSGLVLLVSLHFLFSSRRLWLPDRLRRVRVSVSAFRQGLGWVRPWLRRIDRVVRPRLEFLFRWPASVLIALICVAMSLAMFVASIVPGGVVIPAVGVIVIAIGLTAHDGVFVSLGAAASAVALWGVWTLVG